MHVHKANSIGKFENNALQNALFMAGTVHLVACLAIVGVAGIVYKLARADNEGVRLNAEECVTWEMLEKFIGKPSLSENLLLRELMSVFSIINRVMSPCFLKKEIVLVTFYHTMHRLLVVGDIIVCSWVVQVSEQ